MTQETIKEFIAKIGFSVDEPSQRRFMTGIETAVVKANLLADALAGMARVAAEKVAETSDNLEKLGYMSARTATSAVHIRAFGQAFQQAGGEAKQGLSVLERFAHFMNVNVRGGAESLVKNVFKVRTEDANGIKREWADVLIDVSEQLAKLTAEDPNAGRAKAHLFANAIGLSYEDVQVMIQNIGELKKAWREALASNEAAGIGPQMTAANAKFEQSLRDFWNRVDNMSVGGQGKLSEALVGPMEALDKWLTANEPGIDQNIGKITGAIGDLATNVSDDMKKVDWPGLAKEMDGFSDAIAKLVGNLRPFIDMVLGLETQTQRDQRFKTWESDPGWWGAIMRGLDWFQNMSPGMPPDASSPGGSLLGRMWGGVKRLFGGGGAPSTKGLDPALDAKIKAKAEQWGIDPAIARRVYASEGGGSNLGYMQPGDNGTSFGPFQLHRGGPGSVGTEYERQTGFSVEDPKHIDDYLDFTMDWVRKHGWGAWSGARKQGIEGYQGVGPLPVARSTPAPDYSPPAPLKPAAPSPSEHPTWFAPKGQQPWEMPSHAWDRLNKALPTEDPNVAALKSAASIDTSKVVNFGGVTNNVTVNAPDPHSAAAMVGLHLDRNAHDTVTNLQGAVQ